MKPTRGFRRQHGFSLVEVMVGVVIGMIAVLVIYQVFATSEGIKRNITAAGDAQQNGLLSSFMMGIELANAGNGLAVAAQDLGACQPTGVGGATPTLVEIANSQLPIPLLINAGANDSAPDSFAVYYSVARTLVSTAPIMQNAPPNSAYVVQSANGFKKGDMIVAITNPSAAFPSTSPCYTSVITADPNPLQPADANGTVTITHTGAPGTVGASATLFNLGPASAAQKVFYDVSGGNLRSQSLLNPTTGAPDNGQPVNPLASNVLNVKLQYGIDTVGDGLIHHWVPAVAGTPYGDWDAKTMLTLKPYTEINRIKAARIAILVRSEQHDKELAGQGLNHPVFNDCADSLPGSCGVTFSVPAVATAIQPYGWRYRIYETVIPLRNEVWNKDV